jgi:hypothetical protein
MVNAIKLGRNDLHILPSVFLRQVEKAANFGLPS